MPTILKKIFLEFSKGVIDRKKIITIAKQDREDVEKLIHYVSILKGKKEIHKQKISKQRYLELQSSAIRLTEL